MCHVLLMYCCAPLMPCTLQEVQGRVAMQTGGACSPLCAARQPVQAEQEASQLCWATSSRSQPKLLCRRLQQHQQQRQQQQGEQQQSG
jgi:hypothetical protein